MKLKKVVLSFYLSNQDVVRVKISPYSIIFAVLIGVGISVYPKMKLDAPKVVETKPETISVKKKPLVKLVKTIEEKVETIDDNRFEVKNFTIENQNEKLKFFLTKKENTPGPRKGIIKVRNKNLKMIEESFEFNNGRYTEVPLKESFKKDLSSFVVEVIESNKTVLKQEIVMKDGRFKVIRN